MHICTTIRIKVSMKPVINDTRRPTTTVTVVPQGSCHWKDIWKNVGASSLFETTTKRLDYYRVLAAER